MVTEAFTSFANCYVKEIVNYPRSVYLHIPFCHRRCFYCDFPVIPLGDKARGDYGPGSSSIQSYLKLLYREIALVAKVASLSTIYIGGGTPSLLAPRQVYELLDHLNNHFGIINGAEITLEIDPASFDKKGLWGYIDAGVNRFSLGAQSFDNSVLKQIGRTHDSNNLRDSCNWIGEAYKRGKIRSWSLDLIQNLPGQTISSWKYQLKEAINTDAPHLSIYDLSIEDGTVFAWRESLGQLNLPNEHLSIASSRETSLILGNAGYSRYEISNFALPGHASRHNRVYWSSAGWWAFGQGATSCPWGERYTRPRYRKDYEKWIIHQEMNGIEPSLLCANRKQIGLDDLLLTGLRTREGVNFQELAIDWGWDQKQIKIFFAQLESRWCGLIENGLIKQKGTRFYLSDPEGMDISNQILVEMILWWDSLPRSAVDPTNL